MAVPSKAQRFQEDMIRCRGIEFARLGMMVEVDGDMGTIQGMNASANLDVVFTNQLKHGKRSHNCHPTSKVKYFDESGTLIAHFDENECVLRPERPAAQENAIAQAQPPCWAAAVEVGDFCAQDQAGQQMILADKLLAVALAGFALCGAGYFYGRNNVAFSLILSVTMICLFFLGVFDGAGDLICGMKCQSDPTASNYTENVVVKALMYLMFGCAVLAVALGVNHLLGLSLDLPLGANGAVYLGIVLGSAMSLHRINESPNKQEIS